MNMIRLECTTGGHNKYYEFHGNESKGRFTIKGHYGAIGQAPKEAIVYDGDSKTEAEKEFEKKKSEKLKKGYVVVSQNEQKVHPVNSEKKRLIFP
jgi:predicted DNA-binding WGR domain protein